jgi:hypothetical protein
MANDAYKVLADTSLHRPIRTAETSEGVVLEEVTGQAYAAGDYVFADELTQRDRERAENGDLDHLLEPADLDEAQAARAAVDTGLFIPEHEAERYALLENGHRVIEKDQVLELRSAGEGAAKEAIEATRGENDNSPQITEQPSFVQVSDLTEGPAMPGEGKQDAVSDFEVANAPSSSDAGVEMPPGLPVGPALAKAEGANADEVDQATEKSAEKPKRRSRPGSSSSSDSGSSSSS